MDTCKLGADDTVVLWAPLLKALPPSLMVAWLVRMVPLASTPATWTVTAMTPLPPAGSVPMVHRLVVPVSAAGPAAAKTRVGAVGAVVTPPPAVPVSRVVLVVGLRSLPPRRARAPGSAPTGPPP